MGDQHDDRFETLYAYYGAIVSFLIKQGFPREDARDLAQDVFVRVYEHMETYRADAKWSFLTQVARRLGLNAIRAKHTAKREVELAPEEDLAKLQAKTPGPDQIYARGASDKRLHEAIAQLGTDDRIIVMMQLAEHSYGEMAQMLDISVSAVKSRLYVARGRLRELLGEDPDGIGW